MKLFKTNEENVLVIGDLHLPFEHKDYLKHCKDTYKKYKCNKVIFIGDVLDNHYSSFHPTDPDGYSAGEELDRVINKLRKWYSAFPEVDVVLGNHDTMALRQMYASGVSKRWVKEYKDVLEVGNWNFKDHFIHNNVLYTHGQGSANLLTTITNQRINIVRGHFHTKFEIQYSASPNDILWGMSVGCGVDPESYAFAYGKYFLKKSVLGCGVVLNNGKQPILVPMDM